MRNEGGSFAEIDDEVAAVLAFVISSATFLAAQDDEMGRCPKVVCKSLVISNPCGLTYVGANPASLRSAAPSRGRGERMRLCDLISVSLEQRLDHGLEVGIQLFGRRLHFVFAYPPLDHFDEAAGDVIQEEIFGDRDFLVVVQEVGGDEAGEARLEVAQEEVGAFRDEQVAQVVRILCDML